MNLKFDWKVHLGAAPHQVWRYVADTNQINQYAGLPEFTFRYIPESDGGSRQLGEMSYLGFRLRWDEYPFEWVEGRYYEVVRAYHNGPLRKLHTLVTLTPENGGTLLHQTVTCEPRWAFVIPILYWDVGFQAKRRFSAAYQKIDSFLQGKSEEPFTPSPRVAIPPGRLDIIRRRVGQAPGRQWLPRLIDAIETMPDEELDVMRPFMFADRWNADRREVLKLFLHASQAGLLDLSWDVICPSCRGPQERYDSLRRLKTEAHCPACNIEFTSDFAQNVEVCFRPNAAIRRIDVARYCSGGPNNATHVVAQQQIPAGKAKTLDMHLNAWKYRVRSLKLDSFAMVTTSAGSTESNALIKIHRPTLEPPYLELAPDVSLTLTNEDTKDITVMIERVAGNENAATAAMVIAMSEFRALFSEEVLTPDTPISVGAVSIMFTDLRASTALYEEIGQADAYGLVRRHFEILGEVIANCGGALVKTIGDSVMAVFTDPAGAVQASFEILERVDKDNAERGKPELTLKIGIHYGPCIAVNLNNKLDYFGTAVNLAARIEKESQGRDIIVTEEILKDPHVQEELKRRKYQCSEETCTLRGLAGSRTIYRIKLS